MEGSGCSVQGCPQTCPPIFMEGYADFRRLKKNKNFQGSELQD